MNDMKELMKLIEMLKNPKELNEFLTMIVETAKPILYHAGAEYAGIYKDYVNNEEWRNLRAKEKYLIFKAYMDAGFTEDQAMSLLLTETHNAVMRAQSMTKSMGDGIAKGLTD